MAKTKQEQFEAKLSKTFYEGGWKFRGTQFICRTSLEGRESIVGVTFSCGYGWVKAVISAEYYHIPESVRMFSGEKATEECIRWAAYKVCEADDTVVARVTPYVGAKQRYERALRGE